MSLFGWLDGSDKTAKNQKKLGQQAAADARAAALQAAGSARAAAAAQAASLEFNARVFAANAVMVEEKSLLDEARTRQQGTRVMGEFEGSIAASGFQDTGFGNIRELNEETLDVDALIVRRQGQAERADYKAKENLAYMGKNEAIRAGEAAAEGAIMQGEAAAKQSILSGNIASQQTKSSSMWSGVGTVIGAIGAISDRTVKRDITRVGTLPSGLPFYRYRLLWSDEFTQGVMADEAIKVFPDAVSRNDDGLLVVDYSRIG